MSENNILIMKGQSQYGVLRKVVDCIAEGFENKGYTVEIWDIEKGCTLEDLLQKMQSDYAFIFSCQAIVLNVHIDNRPLPELFTNTYISWLFDDALYHYGRVKNACYPHVYLDVVDEELLETIPIMVPNAQNVAFLPHGGFTNEHEDYNKTIDILFPATIAAEPVLEKMLPDPMPIELLLIDETKKVLAESPALSIRKALYIVLRKYDITLTTDLLLELDRVITYLDQYTRYFCKVRIIEALLDSGFTVHMMGNGGGYDTLQEKHYEHLIYLGTMDIEQVVEAMGHAKIVINPCPVFSEGYHERIFTSLLNKAVCFTPYSPYLDEHMGGRLKYIHLNQLEDMTKQIRDILDNYLAYNSFIEDNYMYSMANHTWEKRAEEIITRFEQNKKN